MAPGSPGSRLALGRPDSRFSQTGLYGRVGTLVTRGLYRRPKKSPKRGNLYFGSSPPGGLPKGGAENHSGGVGEPIRGARQPLEVHNIERRPEHRSESVIHSASITGGLLGVTFY